MKKSRSYYLPISFVVIFLALGFGISQVFISRQNYTSSDGQVKQEETSKWLICTDKVKGITMKYPTGFKLGANDCNYSHLDYSEVQNIEVTNPTEELRKNWLIDIDTISSDQSAEDWIKRNKCSDNPLCSEIKPGPIPHSSMFDISAHYSESDIVVETGNRLVIFSLQARNPNTPVNTEVRNVFSQIISTFRLVK